MLGALYRTAARKLGELLGGLPWEATSTDLEAMFTLLPVTKLVSWETTELEPS